MIYSTPNWPYDLTPAQQKEEEQAIRTEISAISKRIVEKIVPRIEELLLRLNLG